MAPLQFKGDCDQVIGQVETLIRQLPRVRVVERRENYLHTTFTSLVFRFVDDVEFYADSQSQLLHFRSASRVGYSDLGANRKRMDRITQLLEQQGLTKST
jgi:uncharacterized protein (DUF1499 family)